MLINHLVFLRANYPVVQRRPKTPLASNWNADTPWPGLSIGRRGKHTPFGYPCRRTDCIGPKHPHLTKAIRLLASRRRRLGSVDGWSHVWTALALHDSLSVSFKDRLDAVMASANDHLNQKLPYGFRREGHLAINTLEGIAVLPDRIRITANAHGNLRFVYER